MHSAPPPLEAPRSPPWPTQPLEALATVVRESVDPATQPQAPYIGLEHIGAGTLSLLGTTPAAQVTSTVRAFRAGDILFGSLRPYFRKVVRPDHDGLCTPEAWVVRPLPGVDPGFLLYVLADPGFIARCTQGAQGTRMPRVAWSFARTLQVPCPPLPEQQRIGHALGLLDAKRRVHRAMGTTLQALLQARFRQAFCDPASRGWPAGTLGELATRHRERVEPGALPDDTPCVGLGDLDRGSLRLERWGCAADATSTKIRFRRGDLLFGALRPALRKVVVAPVDGICSSDMLVLRPRHADGLGHLLGWLTHDPVLAYAAAVATGTRMPRVSWTALARYPVAKPPAAQLAAFETEARPLVQRILVTLDERRALATLRDRLLPGLVSGTLQLPDATRRP